jgi:hypothetical protein
MRDPYLYENSHGSLLGGENNTTVLPVNARVASRWGLTPRGIDLPLDERDTIDLLRVQTVVGSAEKPEMLLVVAVIQSERLQMLDLQSGSRSAPGPV